MISAKRKSVIGDLYENSLFMFGCSMQRVLCSESERAGVRDGIQEEDLQVSEEIRSGQVLDAKTGKPIEGRRCFLCPKAITMKP